MKSCKASSATDCRDVKTLTPRAPVMPRTRRKAGPCSAPPTSKEAPTFNFPLIARVAASLSRLIGELPPAFPIPLNLIDAHVTAIEVIYKKGMQDTNDKIAQALCVELDARVDETVADAVK